MTEYTTSPHAFREFMSARERTQRWIQSVSPSDAELYSPSVPPSVLEGLIPSSPPSEADSTNSTPPRMVLRYNDGRPDVPIPHPNGVGRSGSKRHQESNVPRSHTSYNHPNNRARSDLSPASVLSQAADVVADRISTHAHPKRFEFCLPLGTDQHPPALLALPTPAQSPFPDLLKGLSSRSPSYLPSYLPHTCNHTRHTLLLMVRLILRPPLLSKPASHNHIMGGHDTDMRNTHLR